MVNPYGQRHLPKKYIYIYQQIANLWMLLLALKRLFQAACLGARVGGWPENMHILGRGRPRVVCEVT